MLTKFGTHECIKCTGDVGLFVSVKQISNILPRHQRWHFLSEKCISIIRITFSLHRALRKSFSEQKMLWFCSIFWSHCRLIGWSKRSQDAGQKRFKSSIKADWMCWESHRKYNLWFFIVGEETHVSGSFDIALNYVYKDLVRVHRDTPSGRGVQNIRNAYKCNWCMFKLLHTFMDYSFFLFFFQFFRQFMNDISVC